MNNKAVELGLSNTHFETPHGLDTDNHYTTAYELALLSNYAMQNKTFANIVNTKTCTININGYPKTITNTNELLGNLNGVYGIKTGFTNGANRCLVSCCKRGNMDVICVVLGADTKNFRTKDSINLLEYTFQNFEPVDIEQIVRDEFSKWKEEFEDNLVIDKGINDVSIDIDGFKNVSIPINKDKKNLLNTEINCETHFYAPIQANQIIGKLVLKCDNQVVSEFPIKTTVVVNKKSIFNYLHEFFSNYIAYFDEFLQ